MNIIQECFYICGPTDPAHGQTVVMGKDDNGLWHWRIVDCLGCTSIMGGTRSYPRVKGLEPYVLSREKDDLFTMMCEYGKVFAVRRIRDVRLDPDGELRYHLTAGTKGDEIHVCAVSKRNGRCDYISLQPDGIVRYDHSDETMDMDPECTIVTEQRARDLVRKRAESIWASICERVVGWEQ